MNATYCTCLLQVIWSQLELVSDALTDRVKNNPILPKQRKTIYFLGIQPCIDMALLEFKLAISWQVIEWNYLLSQTRVLAISRLAISMDKNNLTDLTNYRPLYLLDMYWKGLVQWDNGHHWWVTPHGLLMFHMLFLCLHGFLLFTKTKPVGRMWWL